MDQGIRLFICGALGACLLGCSVGDRLWQIQRRGTLQVVTQNGPDTYYEHKGEEEGFEYELVSRFAEELGVRLEIRVEYSTPDILQYMRRGQADMAAAGIAITPGRQREFRFSRPYNAITPRVLYLAGAARPRRIEDLAQGLLVVAEGGSHAETLASLKERAPELSWREVPDAEPVDLMGMIDAGEADFTIIDSNAYIANRAFHPAVRIGFSLDQTDELAWLFAPGPDTRRLRRLADDFLRGSEGEGGLLEQLEMRQRVLWDIGPANAQTFNLAVDRKLSTYEAMIRQVADEYQLDWHLLAAIAYQESHWNPLARSPTGVRGMMMLTRNTSREMGVKDRLDPLQSLRGGARYFRKIRRSLPRDIAEPERTWFALAAYNVGRGHLEDARVLTERHGGDPHEWAHVAKRLPLLQKREFHRGTRHGYARGTEAVTYVTNIRHYHRILSWRDISETQPPPPIDTEQLLPPALRGGGMAAL